MVTLMPQHNSLSVLDDDNMEISSDVGLRDDDDKIDIDFDFGDQAQPNDDYMLEDGPAEDLQESGHASQFAKDDDMIDGAEETGEQEDGLMSYEEAEHDEELEDAGLDQQAVYEIVDQIGDVEDLGLTTNPPSSALADFANAIEASTTESAVVIELASPNETSLQTSDMKRTNQEHSINLNKIVNQELVDQDYTYPEGEGDSYPTGEGESVAHIDEIANSPPHPNTNLEHGYELEESNGAHYSRHDDSAAEDLSHDHEGTATQHPANGAGLDSNNVTTGSPQESHFTFDSRYHPVIIFYDGAEIDLLPTNEESTSMSCFLTDRSVVTSTLHELLGHCRDALGDHVTENEELEIEVAELGLRLSEDSSHATQFSLADMLDVFVQLCQNDGVDSPDPLYMSLSTKPRFAARMAVLNDGLKNNKGLTHFGFVDGHEHEHEYVDSEGEEHDDIGQIGNDQESTEPQHNAQAQLEEPSPLSAADGEAEAGKRGLDPEFQMSAKARTNINHEDQKQALLASIAPAEAVVETPSFDVEAEEPQDTVDDGIDFAHEVDASTADPTSHGQVVGTAPEVLYDEVNVTLEHEPEEDLLDYSEEDDEEEANGHHSATPPNVQADEARTSPNQGKNGAADDVFEYIKTNDYFDGQEHDDEISHDDAEDSNALTSVDPAVDNDQIFDLNDHQGSSEYHQDEKFSLDRPDQAEINGVVPDEDILDLGETYIDQPVEAVDLQNGKHSSLLKTSQLKRPRVEIDDDLDKDDSGSEAKKARSAE